MGKVMDGHTLEYVLTEQEDCLASRMKELVDRLKEDDYPLTVAVYFRGRDDSGAKQVVKLTVANKITTVVNLLDEIRKRLVDDLGPRPIGNINFKAWPKGESADPPVNFRRELVAPSGDVDGEKEYLKRRVRELEQQLGVAMGQVMSITGMLAERNVGMAEAFQKLATTRGAVNGVSDVSPVSLIAGALIVPALMPVLNKQLGLASDAPMSETWKRAQLLITAGIAKVQTSFAEDGIEVHQVVPETRRLGDLGDQPRLPGPGQGAPSPSAPSNAEATNAAPTPAAEPAPPPAPVRPTPEQLVGWMVEDPAYSQAVFLALVGNPVAKAALKANLPTLTLMLG